MPAPEILVDGMTAREVLALPEADLEALLLRPERLVLRAGAAEILASFRVRDRTLTLEVGDLDGRGEGVLRWLQAIARRYAAPRGIARLEWLVHAVSGPAPSAKLGRVLEKRGFAVEDVPGSGRVHRLVEELG